MSREWDSVAYHQISQPQLGWGTKVLERLKLRGDEAVLDVGCGSGRLTAELLERLPRGKVIALDLSWNMLQSARHHLLPRFAGRVRFIQGNMQELPLEQSAVDGVFSAAAFHWARNHPKLFAGLFRALRPGGWLEGQCGGGPNLERIRAWVDVVRSCAEFREYFAGWEGPWEFANPETTSHRLRQAGFLEVKTWLESAPTQRADADDFKRYLGTVTLHQHLARLPTSELRVRFLDDIAQRSAQDDPPFVMDYWRLNISARKPAKLESEPSRQNPCLS